MWQIEFAVTDQIKVCLDTTLKSIFHSDTTRPSDAVLSFFHCPDAGVSKTPAEFWPTFKYFKMLHEIFYTEQKLRNKRELFTYNKVPLKLLYIYV